MADHTVEAFAQLGDMITPLAKGMACWDFRQCCAEAFFVKQGREFLKKFLRAAGERAETFMLLASTRFVWGPHDPQTVDEALALVLRWQVNATRGERRAGAFHMLRQGVAPLDVV